MRMKLVMKMMMMKTHCPVMHSRTACNCIGLWTLACKQNNMRLLSHVL